MLTIGKPVYTLLLVVLAAPPLLADEGQKDTTAEAGGDERPRGGFGEVVVVTASRTEQSPHEAPSAMTILTSDDLESLPGDDYGDYLRTVPGLNVSQMSARDIQVTGRQATTSVATGELVLLDGRSVYLDFYGFVGWDFLPVDTGEIEQIEVVRGPGSAVWGANAVHGVINLITKPPRETVGTRLTVGGGEVGTRHGNVTHAGVSDNWGYRVSAGYYEQDPYERPMGLVPGTETPYPDFENEGTEQPKLNLRLDYDASPETTWTFSAGYGGTGGMLHTGIGPFALETGSSLSHAQLDWQHHGVRLTAFANFLEGDSENLLTLGSDGEPLLFTVETETYNVDFTDTRPLGSSHLLTYGLNRRRLDFDLNIAPQGEDRDETGLFLQDEILLGERVRWLLGGRWDDIDPVDSVLSPRTSLIFSPRPQHTFRISYGEAFRAPSLIQNFMQTSIVNIAPLPMPVGPFPFPTAALGNLELTEERLESIEAGYVGTLPQRVTLSVAAYYTRLEDATDFFPATFYSAANPPPGWPLPPVLLDAPPPFGLAGLLPESFTFRNIGEIVNQGVEIAFEARPSAVWSVFANYSFQDDPRTKEIPEEEMNQPPRHRINAGAIYNGSRFFAGGHLSFVDDAFWTDVLDSRFWGPTDAYFQVDLRAGLRWAGDRVSLAVTGENVFDEEIQQHVFGDLIGRKLGVELHLEL